MSTASELADVDGLDARATLDAARGGVRARRAAEVEEMRIAAHWAVLHGHPRDERDPMTTPGGDGTPPLRRADRGHPRPAAPASADLVEGRRAVL